MNTHSGKHWNPQPCTPVVLSRGCSESQWHPNRPHGRAMCSFEADFSLCRTPIACGILMLGMSSGNYIMVAPYVTYLSTYLYGTLRQPQHHDLI